jgi:hypothetical protein
VRRQTGADLLQVPAVADRIAALMAERGERNAFEADAS